MRFRCLAIRESVLEAWSGDALAVGLFADPQHPSRSQLSGLFGADLERHLEQRQFKGKPGECACIERLGATPGLLILVGLGDPAAFHLTELRLASATAARQASRVGGRHLGLWMPVEGLEPAAAASAMAEATRLSLYTDQRFKSEIEPRTLPEEVTLLALPEAEIGRAHV